MRVYKMFVDDKDIDTEDGYTLYIDSEYTLGTSVYTAVLNGYKDIRISVPDKRELAEFTLLNGISFNED